MSGGRKDASTPDLLNGGEFLLSLLQRPHQQPQTPLQPRPAQPLTVDPAVAAVGPTVQFPVRRPPSGHDHFPPLPQNLSPPFPHSYPQNYVGFADDLRRLGTGFRGINSTGVAQQGEQNLRFGSFSFEIGPSERLPNGNSIESSSLDNVREVGSGSRNHSMLERNRQVNRQGNSIPNADVFRPANFDSREHGRGRGGWGNHNSNQGVNLQRFTPPGFPAKPREGNNGGLSENRRGFEHSVGESRRGFEHNVGGSRRGFEHNVGERSGNFRDSRHNSSNLGDERPRGRRVPFNDHGLHGWDYDESDLPRQLGSPSPPQGSKLHSVPGSEIEESLSNLHLNNVKEENRAEGGRQHLRGGGGGNVDAGELDEFHEHIMDALLEDESDDKNKKINHVSREKEYRSDSRGQRILNQRMRNLKRFMDCRSDINRLNTPFLRIYESLIPPDEEKAKQKQLLSLLENLVNKEWPEARLYLYGSCASSFGVCKNDIDVCLAFEDADFDKSEVLLKLAEILEADNLQNVQMTSKNGGKGKMTGKDRRVDDRGINASARCRRQGVVIGGTGGSRLSEEEQCSASGPDVVSRSAWGLGHAVSTASFISNFGSEEEETEEDELEEEEPRVDVQPSKASARVASVGDVASSTVRVRQSSGGRFMESTSVESESGGSIRGAGESDDSWISNFGHAMQESEEETEEDESEEEEPRVDVRPSKAAVRFARVGDVASSTVRVRRGPGGRFMGSTPVESESRGSIRGAWESGDSWILNFGHAMQESEEEETEEDESEDEDEELRVDVWPSKAAARVASFGAFSTVRVRRGPGELFLGSTPWESKSRGSIKGVRMSEDLWMLNFGSAMQESDVEVIDEDESEEEEPRVDVRSDDSWILHEAAPGGPDRFDMIPSFGGHVALDLWEDSKARGVLNTYPREDLLTLLERRWPVPEASKMERLVEASGLSHLRWCLPTNLDVPLLSAFIERWQPDTNSFHMPFGEMTIMLHDVEQILRLPTEGRVCAGAVVSEQMLEELFYPFTMDEISLTFADVGARLYDNGGLHQEGMLTLFRHHNDAHKQTQAYLMYLIGSTLFEDKTGMRVRKGFLSLLGDTDSVHEYAWGAGTLAYLYRSMGVATRAESKGVNGCLALLQCWIYEYFPDFAPARVKLMPEVAQRLPRSVFWGKNEGRRSNLESVRALLDQLTADRVNWIPYGHDQHVMYPRTLYSGVIRCLDIMEPYQPNRCLRQLGYVQTIPSPIIRPDDACRGRKSNKYKVKFVGRVHDDNWGSLDMHRLVIHDGHALAVPPHQCADNYLTWFLARSHPRILAAGHVVHDKPHIATYVGYKAMNTFFGLMRNGASPDRVWEQTNAFMRDAGPHMAQYYGAEGVPVWPPADWEPDAVPSGSRSVRGRRPHHDRPD